ncbi:FxSxx-COOH cyclophane-containing RiPP peptide [Actinomadura sediminis]|uniref:FxSxx-COOH cyclophane-containing RiPP peptide n=1 Tax=Actinomadura sediminis TaxID=1038904 RepID=A0ABW3ENT1_9ACTN
MSYIDSSSPDVVIDLTGLSLKELDELGDRVIEDALRSVLDPSRGEVAAAGFDSKLFHPSIDAATAD